MESITIQVSSSEDTTSDRGSVHCPPVKSKTDWREMSFMSYLKPREPDVKGSKLRPERRPALIPVKFPKVPPRMQNSLATQGWTSLALPANCPLRFTLDSLFAKAVLFFARPEEQKAAFAAPPVDRSVNVNEREEGEGWSRLEDGKGEMLSLRTIPGTPPEIQAAARRAWAEGARQLDRMVGLAAESLELPNATLTRFSTPCGELTSQRTPAVLRLIRHENDAEAEAARKSWKKGLESQHDRGLLTLIYTDSPCLELWDRHAQRFRSVDEFYVDEHEFSVEAEEVDAEEEERFLGEGEHSAKEKEYFTEEGLPFEERRYHTDDEDFVVEPNSVSERHAMVFSGRQLERFSNQRYPTGGRRLHMPSALGVRSRSSSFSSVRSLPTPELPDRSRPPSALSDRSCIPAELVGRSRSSSLVSDQSGPPTSIGYLITSTGHLSVSTGYPSVSTDRPSTSSGRPSTSTEASCLPSIDSTPFRYSIVLELHAHTSVPVVTEKLMTKITGSPRFIMEGPSTEIMNRQIQSARFDYAKGLEIPRY